MVFHDSSYLWGSRCGGGPSTWHYLLCDITPALVGVSYSYLSEEMANIGQVSNNKLQPVYHDPASTHL